MSQYLGWESARQKFQNTWMGQVVSLAEQALWDAELVNTKLYVRTPVWADTVDDTYNLRLLYPAPYRGYNGSTYVDNTPDRTTTTSMDVATKALARQLDPKKFRWVGQAATPSAQMWRELHENGTQILTDIVRQIELRNELECWDSLTQGIITTMSGYIFTLPIHGITNAGGGISYHTREAWFNNAGVVDAAATIIDDIQAGVQYMATNNFDTPTTLWMNYTTFTAITGNTVLSKTGGDYWWQPLSTMSLNNQLIDWKDKNKIRMAGLFKPFGLKVIVNDSFYRTTAGAQVKYLPDYYAVLTGDRVGKRYITMNSENGTPDKYSKSWVTPPPSTPTLNFEIGESSMCYPDNRGNLDPTTGLTTWKSHYTMYTKAP